MFIIGFCNRGFVIDFAKIQPLRSPGGPPSNPNLKPMQESNSEFSQRKHEKLRHMLPTNDILKN